MTLTKLALAAAAHGHVLVLMLDREPSVIERDEGRFLLEKVFGADAGTVPLFGGEQNY